MKKVSILLVLVLMFSIAAIAQDAGKTVKIGVVNLQSLIQKTELGKTIATKIQQFRDSKMSTFNEERTKLQADAKQLESQASILSPDALTERQNDLQRRDLDLRQNFQKAQREFQTMSNEEVAKFYKIIIPVIEQVGLEGNYTLILDGSASAQSQIVYVDKTIDLTDTIIAKVNASSKK